MTLPIYYFDTTALVKYYRDENGTPAIRKMVVDSPTPILISPLTKLEFLSWVMKSRRRKDLKKKEVTQIVARFNNDIGSATKIRNFSVTLSPSQVTFDNAERLLLRYAAENRLESNDSLHLAIFMGLQKHNPIITLVTSDSPLANVSRAEAVTVYNPEESVA